MEILSYQDLINNASTSLKESKELQQTVIAYGLLQETIQLEYISSHNICNAMDKLNDDGIEIIEQLAIRLANMAKQKRLKNSIRKGDKVAKGFVAGIKTLEGKHYALIDGPDFHQWQRLEEIEL